MSEIVAVSVGGASRLMSSGAGAAPTAPLQGTPGPEGPDDHVPHSGTPQKPDVGHGDPSGHFDKHTSTEQSAPPQPLWQ